MVHREDPLLISNVEHGFPAELAVGAGNVWFVSGWAFHRRRRIAELAIRLDGSAPSRVIYPMPRGDVYREYADFLGPDQHAYRSGFWAYVPVEAEGRSRVVRAELIATLSNGHISTRTLAPVRLERQGALSRNLGGTPARDREPMIAICMASFDPIPALFRRQVESLRAQTHKRWICLVSDDHSSPDAYELIRSEIEGDPRFRLTRSPGRLGFYRNFERALGMVPEAAELVALADQDDYWYPEKLEVLRGRLGETETLAYGDMRVVSGSEEPISPTLFRHRRDNHTNLASLMIGNTVTGAASLFKRELLADVLPFPQGLGHDFHDQWLATVALALGRIAYVERPLQDYIQHANNAFGADRAQLPARSRLRALPANRLAVSQMLGRWRHEYFVYVRPVQLRANVLQLRLGSRMRGRRARTTRWLCELDGSGRSVLVVLWLYLRSIGARARRAPTTGNERLLVRGVAWRWLVRVQSLLRRRGREGHRQALAVPAAPTVASKRQETPLVVRQIPTKIAPIALEVRSDAPARVNMMIPTIDLEHFFGAYIGKFNLAGRLAQMGLRVRFVAVDPTDPPRDWRERIQEYEGLDSIFDDGVEVSYWANRESRRLDVNPEDRFIATTSWTAHVAHRACTELGRERFLFVIQEYDALTYPVGTLGAVVREAYSHPHTALFSTEFLREYFRRHRLGVFSGPDALGEGDRLSTSFRNAITPLNPPAPEALSDQSRRILFYARPEPHAERNLFELGLLSLAEAIKRGAFPPGWEFVGIGAQEPQTLEILPGADLQILPRMRQDEYRSLLGRQAIGLALMDTPHPSLVPLEMASAGMLVVTSTFENKTRRAMREISSNLIGVEPTVEGVVNGLAEARRRQDKVEQRAAGAGFDWPRSWSESFDEGAMSRILALLEAS